MAASKLASYSSKASDMLHDYACSTCEESELNKEGCFYCEQCVKLFCEDCAKGHDQMYKKHRLLGKKDVSKWVATRPTVRGEQCPLHAGNVIQLYCTQHDDVGCTVCFLTDHTECKTTEHIANVAKGIFQNPEFMNLLTSTKSSQEKLRKKKTTKKKHSKIIDDTCDNIIKSAKDTRKRVDREMARLEKKTIDDVEEWRSTLKAALKADEEAFEKKELELQQFLDAFQDKTYQNETSVFIGVKKCKLKLKEAENVLKSISEEPYQIIFNAYNDIEAHLSTFQSLGTFDVMPKSDYSGERIKPYTLRISSDEGKCCITGLCSLPNRNFLAVDNSNNRVKLLDGQFNVISHHDFPSCPRDICNLGDYKVAVTVGKQIHYLDASKNQLKLTKKITCGHECCGIDYYNNRLYVTSYTALYIYNMFGKRGKKLYEDNSGQSTIYRVSVAWNGQHIYVTNLDSDQLITLDKKGNKLATFSDPDLRGPEGLYATGNGTVFVLGHFSNTVLQVSSDGTKKLATVAGKGDGVYSPLSLLLHEATSQLIVERYGDENSLLVISVN